MTSFLFAGPYKPIVCGIADYTRFVNDSLPFHSWPVLSFDLARYGAPLDGSVMPSSEPVWYGIPDRSRVSASVITQGVSVLDGSSPDTVLWFQHETGIWPDIERFSEMLRGLDGPKIVTFHTLHFESPETPAGLRRYQVGMLRRILPHVDAITVFSRGVFNAVVSEFPQYRSRIHLMKHGIHAYPDISSLSRREARERLNDFLLYEADIDRATREALHKNRVLLDPNAIVLGQTGFLCPSKQTETLYDARDQLQELLPRKRIAALRIGSPRDDVQKAYADQLRKGQGRHDRYLIETRLPADVLPLAQRALDLNLSWPAECTQSGILAHALGAGAVVAGRDLEGMGETLKEAGAIVDRDLRCLVGKIAEVLVNPEAIRAIEERALMYAEEFSWTRQAWKHHELASSLVFHRPQWPARYPSFETDPIDSVLTGTEPAHGSGETSRGVRSRELMEVSRD